MRPRLGVTASIPVGSDIGAYRGVAEAAALPGGPACGRHRLLRPHRLAPRLLPLRPADYAELVRLASEAGQRDGSRSRASTPASTQWLGAARVGGLATLPTTSACGRSPARGFERMTRRDEIVAARTASRSISRCTGWSLRGPTLRSKVSRGGSVEAAGREDGLAAPPARYRGLARAGGWRRWSSAGRSG